LKWGLIVNEARAHNRLNVALGGGLVLVNKGFVQSLCLWFDDSRSSAELAYSDNLAATRRLMQLIRAMQRLGVRLDPDGADQNADRSDAELQSTELAIWSSDLQVVVRTLDPLRGAQAELELAGVEDGAVDAIVCLAEECEAFAAALRSRAENSLAHESGASEQRVSDAEGTNLEGFLKGLADTDSTLLNGRLESEGQTALAEVRIRHSLAEMSAAYRVAQRILVLGAKPASVFSPDLHVPHRIDVGSSAADALSDDLILTERLEGALEHACAAPAVAADRRSVELLSVAIGLETEMSDWLSTQKLALSQSAQPAPASGAFDHMLERWSVE
tara:strand:+ start:695 stop:1687 length:993 start_codon:yes stop_codon:yes gene_type:complete